MRHSWSETGASLSMRAISTSVGDTVLPMQYLYYTRVILQPEHLQRSPTCVKEVCGVGVAVGTFWAMLSVVLTTVSWWCTVGSIIGCPVVLSKSNSIETKLWIYRCHPHTMDNDACPWFGLNPSGARVSSDIADSGFSWLIWVRNMIMGHSTINKCSRWQWKIRGAGCWEGGNNDNYRSNHSLPLSA